MTAERLSARTAAGARAAVTDLPGYDRSTPPSIVHLGVGAFARAHLGVYADDLLRAGWPAMVHGVSLRSPRAEEQLRAQDGLYTVTEREPGEVSPPRVVGSLASVATGRAAAVAAIASAATTLVTLTVTEKGYAPEAVPRVVADGLAGRDRGLAPPVIASLDNVLDNGVALREVVLGVAGIADPGLAAWIADTVAFPSSVVDRMVPATTADDLDEIEARLGLRDEAAVVAERHCSWVISAADGLPPLGDIGVQVVGDVAPYQRRKLWLLNGPHSTTAHAGLLAGCETIAAAGRHPLVEPFVAAFVADVLQVADRPDGTEPHRFAAAALRRFGNEALGHTCRQVGADGSQKLSQRLLPVVAARRRAGLGTERFALVVAAWLVAVAGIPVAGVTLPPLEDPVADELARVGRQDLGALARAGVGARAEPGFVAEVAGALERLARQGIRALGDPR